MSPPSGAASYKKKDGTLAISTDEKSVSWSPAVAGAGNTITIPVLNITSMQSLHGRAFVLFADPRDC